jgi:hypothetical protein
MGSMICCSSLEGKYEEKDMESDSVHPSSENIQMTSPAAVIQQPVLPRVLSQQTLPPN